MAQLSVGWCAMLKGTFERDQNGFWTAYVEQGDGVRVRYPLPVPFTATYSQALFAYEGLIARLERLAGYEHR